MTETMTAQKAMPLYECHKVVHALKIAAAEIQKDGAVKITPADEGFSTFTTEPEFWERFKGTSEDPGYYVVYKDGYKSWSPTKAFEEGYTKI